ncbi:type II toxin-antitoxin system Phd/YefM family antitoxin [Streptomyces sp. NPDC058086]|uniref:type II toxin-antitoxin system Phd/YefM family antitoxin n=1 Tax=Streptomyces sp. NPDC058086 TaxID=3346334 RepID=UPI0036E8CA23
MKTMTCSESRARYAEVLNAVTDDREEVVITRAGHEPVVIVSLEDYESLKETAYLADIARNGNEGSANRTRSSTDSRATGRAASTTSTD